MPKHPYITTKELEEMLKEKEEELEILRQTSNMHPNTIVIHEANIALIKTIIKKATNN